MSSFFHQIKCTSLFLVGSLVVVPSLFSTPVYGKIEPPKSGCFDKNRAYDIARGIKITVGTGKAPLRRCDPRGRFYKLMEALEFMKNLKFEGRTPPRPYNQDILGYNWHNMFLNSTRSIGFGTPKNCRDANAYTFPHSTGMYMCDGFYDFFGEVPEDIEKRGDPSIVSRMGILLHEYRHMTTGKLHKACNGQGQGCDPSLEYLGAFAAHMEAHAKIALNATNIHPAQAAHSSRTAWYIAQYRFLAKIDLPELETRELVVIQRDDGELFSFGPKEPLKEVFKKLPRGGQIFPMIYQGNDSFLYIPSNPQQELKLFDSYAVEDRPAYLYFNNDYESGVPFKKGEMPSLLIPYSENRNLFVADLALIKDTFFNEWWLIEDRKVKLEIDIVPFGTPTPIPYQLELTLPLGEIPIRLDQRLINKGTGARNSQMHIYMESGRIFRVDRKMKFAREMTPDDYRLTEVFSEYPGFQVQFVPKSERTESVKNDLYFISPAGGFIYENSRGEMTHVPGAENMKFRKFFKIYFVTPDEYPTALAPYVN